MLPRVFEADRAEAHIARSQVWDTDLALRRGTLYQINAASGMGKSSLCAFIIGARSDYSGRITFDGRDAASLRIADWCSLRRTSLAYLPQGLDLFPELSAVDNILLKNRLSDMRTEAEIRRMLASLGVADRADAPAGRLSVGQQQRVALVRALCQPADFILLDEPVSHLDAANNALCARMVAETAAALGAAVISTSVGNPLMLPQPVTLLEL